MPGVKTEGKIKSRIHALPIGSKSLSKEWIHTHLEKIHGLDKPSRVNGKRWIQL
jgi:hypothetical protein